MATTRRPKRSRSPVKTSTLLKNVDQLSIGKPQTDADVSTFPISFEKDPVAFVIGGAVSAFELSSLYESPRKTLTLRLPQIWEDGLVEWEAGLVAYVMKHRTTFFGAAASEADVTGGYTSFTKKTCEYPRNINLKVNTTGFYAVRYWDATRESIPPLASHIQARFNVRCVLRAIWVKDLTWGCVVDGTDLQLLEQASTECPF